MATSKVSGKPSRRSVIKHTMDHPKLNDQTSLGISVKWLIQIIIVAAMVVWGYFGLTSKISHLETDVLRMKDSVSHWKPIITSSASIKGDNISSPKPTATLSNHPSFSHLTFIFFFFKFNISCFGFVFACTICGGVCFFFACPHKAINQ